MAKRCQTVQGNRVCPKPHLFMRSYLGYPPFPLFSDAADDVFDLMPTEPLPQLKSNMAIFIDSQVASGNFSLMDVFQFYSMDTAANAVINWIGNYSNGLLVNSPTHDPFDGVSGDGLTEYINSQYNPTDDGVNVGQDDIIVGSWIVLNDDTTTPGAVCLFGDGGNISCAQQSASLRLRHRISSGTLTEHTTATGKFLVGNLYSVSREDSANQKLFEGSVEIDNGARASTALGSVDIDVLACGGGAQNFEAKVACFYAAAKVGFDLANFESNLSTLITDTAALG